MKVFVIPALSILTFFGSFELPKAAGQTKELQEYLDEASKNSPLLNDLDNQRRSLFLDSAILRAQYGPQISLNSFNAYAPVIRGWGYDEAITNGTTLSELVGFNQELPSRKNLRNQFGLLNLERRGVATGREISEKELRRTITTQYIAAYGSQKNYLYNTEVRRLLQQQDAALKALTEKGVYKQTDYLSLLVTLKQQDIACGELHLQFRGDLAMLNELCGIRDTSWVDLSAPELEIPFLAGATATSFYQQFVVDSLLLRNRDVAIDFSYKPRLSLFADAGYLSSLMVTPARNFGASIGASLTIPIYDGHQRTVVHSKIEIEENTREVYSEFFKTQYDQRTTQLMQQLRLTEILISKNQEQLRFLDGLIDAEKRLLQTGDIGVTDYILTITRYLSAYNSITQSEIRRLEVINELNFWR